MTESLFLDSSDDDDNEEDEGVFQGETGTNMKSFIILTRTHTEGGGVCFLHTEAELGPVEVRTMMLCEVARTLQTLGQSGWSC